jgi:hypothetical protein
MRESTEDSSHPDSHTNYRYLNTPEKRRRMQSLRQKVNVSQVQVKRMKEKIEKLVEKRGIEVDSDLHGDLALIMEESTASIGSEYPASSFQRIFWEQQYKAMKLKNAKSMKWQPSMIRLVLIVTCTCT